MSYPDLLLAIARLHVDRAFRQAVLAAGAPASGPLSGLDRQAVVTIGRMADFHRAARVQEHLSWMDFALRPDLVATFERYMAITPPQLLNRDEAVAFCRFLEREPPGAPPYLGELGRYERLRICVAWGIDARGAAPQVEAFSFPIPRILAALGAPGWPDAERGATRLSFKKVPGIPAVLVRG